MPACTYASYLELCHDLVPFILLFSGNRGSDRGRGGWLRLGLWWNLGGLGLGTGGWSVLFTLLLEFMSMKYFSYYFSKSYNNKTILYKGYGNYAPKSQIQQELHEQINITLMSECKVWSKNLRVIRVSLV